MRRRSLTDEERKQLSLVGNESRAAWPVVHPEALPTSEPLPAAGDETGGPLSAAEAGRVMTKQSIRFAGHLFARGLIHCHRCAKFEAMNPPGSGYRMTIYASTSKDVLIGRCGQCGVDVVGEDPRTA